MVKALFWTKFLPLVLFTVGFLMGCIPLWCVAVSAASSGAYCAVGRFPSSELNLGVIAIKSSQTCKLIGTAQHLMIKTWKCSIWQPEHCWALLSIAEHCWALLSIAEHCCALVGIVEQCWALLIFTLLSFLPAYQKLLGNLRSWKYLKPCFHSVERSFSTHDITFHFFQAYYSGFMIIK